MFLSPPLKYLFMYAMAGGNQVSYYAGRLQEQWRSPLLLPSGVVSRSGAVALSTVSWAAADSVVLHSCDVVTAIVRSWQHGGPTHISVCVCVWPPSSDFWVSDACLSYKHTHALEWASSRFHPSSPLTFVKDLRRSFCSLPRGPPPNFTDLRTVK